MRRARQQATGDRQQGRGKACRAAYGLWPIACCLALAACAGGTVAPTPTPALSEQQIAQKAVDALGGVSAFHFDLATDTGGKPIGGSFALVSANGDAIRPDELAATIQAAAGGFTASLQYVSIGDKHYMTDPISRQWMEVPPQFNTVAVFSPEQGAPALVRSLQDLQKTGIEKVDGADSWHLAGSAPGNVLQPLLGASAPSSLKADVWIGTSDFLTRRIKLTGAIFQGDPDTTVRTLELTKFNETVTIAAPAPGTTASPSG